MNKDMTTNNSNSTGQEQWKGYTLDDLRYQRGKSLIRLEIEKLKLAAKAEQIRGRANNEGLRGLFWSNVTLKGLKTTDYLLAGWKISRMAYKLWHKRR